MKVKIVSVKYGLVPEAFRADERKSMDILFPRTGRLQRITIPWKFGINFTNIVVEIDRANAVPTLFIACVDALSFREDPDPELRDGKVVCFQCGALACSNNDHDHVLNFNILRGLPSLTYERGHILRLTATAMRDSSFVVMTTCLESTKSVRTP
jgi:hypothetical protein